MEYRTEDKPAPGRLVIVHGFLNTWSDELGIEDLSTPQAAGKWLRAAGLWDGRKGPKERDVKALRDFREALRSFVLARSSPSTVDRINALSTGIDFSVAFDADGKPELKAVGHGVSGVIGRLLSVILESAAGGSWAHFKCCELETCGWAYYDYSKNHSGRWCSMKTCGSRDKARRYLERKAKRAGER